MSLEFRGIHGAIVADETSEIEAEGARYCGKTWMFSAKVGRAATKFPGMEWLIGRFSNEETRTKIKPEFQRVIGLDQGLTLEWDADASCFLFPEISGMRSKVYAYGLKSQSIVEALAKVRGLGVAGIWNDQSEELPQAISEELRFGVRQPGYPHQLLFSPNPVGEDHFLSDQFPLENPFPHRKHYQLSLYDNAHNLAEGKIAELEALYPPTHAKYKSLILGMRGPNVVGVPVYDGLFNRAQHVGPVTYQKQNLFLEAIHSGQHHPIWVCAQFSPAGGLELLGGIMGKRMMLEDFLPLVSRYRLEWFDPDESQIRLCSDPPPSADDLGNRFTALDILRDAGLKPRSKANATAPDVREAVIQNLATMMRRYNGFKVNADQSRWLTISKDVTKQSKSMVDSLEGSYVWDDHFVSVSNKTVRKPKSDQWLDGWMRCLENIALNFCTLKTPNRQDPGRGRQQHSFAMSRPDSWLGS